jgi:hypothetical protein
MPLANLITSTITLDTIRAPRTGFGKPMIASVHTEFDERAQAVTSVAAALDLGFSSSSAEIAALTAMFGQVRSPRQVVLGRRLTAVAQVWSGEVTDDGEGAYTIPINGVDFTFDATTDTAEAIRDGLVTAINAGDEPVTAAAVSTTELTITADVSGEHFTIGTLASPDDVLEGAETTANVGLFEDAAAIKAYDPTWYAFLETTRTDVAIAEGARWAFGQIALFAPQSNEAGILVAATDTDPFSLLKALGNTRALPCYYSNDSNFFDAAWLGKQLPTQPGSSNWAWQPLAGVAADDLSAPQCTVIEGKNANFLIDIGGRAQAYYGMTAGGQFVDLIIGADKLNDEIRLGLADMFTSAETVPQTQEGINMAAGSVEASIRKLRGLTIPDTIVVDVPLFGDWDPAEKANRVLPDIPWSATIQGAINKVNVTGVLAL